MVWWPALVGIHIKGCLIGVVKVLFSLLQKLKTFQDFSSHRILWHMHEVLNIDKNKTNCIICL